MDDKIYRKYRIDCKSIPVAVIEISGGRYRCTPVLEGLLNPEVQNVPLPVEIAQGQDWGDPIPFFQNKIRNAERFGREDDIGSFTDPFRMVLLEGER